MMTQITAYPTTVFVDSEGKQVGYAVMGAQSEENWVTLIDEALAQLEE